MSAITSSSPPKSTSGTFRNPMVVSRKSPKGKQTRQVEMNLRELQSDYIDAILIHGTPGVEQMTVEQCMEVHAELIKARDKGLVRFVGFSAHHYFDKALALISTNEFDLCMLGVRIPATRPQPALSLLRR